MSDKERISDAQVGRCIKCGETTLAAPHETEIVCKQCERDTGLRPDGGTERPGCHCADCLKADEVYRFNCPDCPDDLDGHHIAGENRAKSINASHKHEASSVEVVWRA